MKEVLAKLTRSFDEIKSEINETTELTVFFDNIIEIKPPPPAPKRIYGNEGE